jgi:hypothetical protein
LSEIAGRSGGRSLIPGFLINPRAGTQASLLGYTSILLKLFYIFLSKEIKTRFRAVAASGWGV